MPVTVVRNSNGSQSEFPLALCRTAGEPHDAGDAEGHAGSQLRVVPELSVKATSLEATSRPAAQATQVRRHAHTVHMFVYMCTHDTYMFAMNFW